MDILKTIIGGWRLDSGFGGRTGSLFSQRPLRYCRNTVTIRISSVRNESKMQMHLTWPVKFERILEATWLFCTTRGYGKNYWRRPSPKFGRQPINSLVGNLLLVVQTQGFRIARHSL